MCVCVFGQILNDITGNLDAKKACSGAMKLHKKYLKKVSLTLGFVNVTMFLLSGICF